MTKPVISSLFLLIMVKMGSAQIDTTNRAMIPMSGTYEKPYKVGSIYFKQDSEEPFTGILFGRYKNGNYLSIQEYKNGIGNGKWVNYYEDGTIKEIGTYIDNLVEGPIVKYHSNGMKKAEGTYKHWRKKVGIWKYYDARGLLIETETY